MSEELKREEILGAGPDDGDWSDVISRASRARRRYQVRAAVLVTALVAVGAASAYALTHHGQSWCKEKPGEAWKKTLASHVVALSRHASVTPLAVGIDGRTFYAVLFSKTYAGIVRIDAGTSRYTKIKRVPRSEMYQAVGSADGRWLVWLDTTDPYWSKWAIWSWDSRTGRVQRIAVTRRVPHAEDWSAASTPNVRDGYAVWAQGIGTGKTGVHVVDLESGRNRVIYRGSASEPFLLRHQMVVWTDDVRALGSEEPVSALRAAEAVTGKRIALPTVLRRLRGSAAATIVSDGGGFVYSAGPWQSLWWSPSLKAAPWRVFTLRQEGNYVDNSLQLAGHYAFFGTSAGPSAYLVDAARGGYVKISRGGWALLNTKALVLLKPSRIKAAHGISDVVFVPLKSLPTIRACSKPATATE